MNETDNAGFVMHGARAAMAGGMPHIGEQVRAIERNVAENPSLAFDLAKTIVESVCKTILADRKVPFTSGDDLPKLYKTVTNALPFLPLAASGEADLRRSLQQTLNGLHTALHWICALRNSCGFASHGSGGARPHLEGIQAMLAAQAADAMVGFLHRIHSAGRTPASSLAPSYATETDFNDYLDDQVAAIQILTCTFKPSEVLFQLDPAAYREMLDEFKARAGEPAEPVAVPALPAGAPA